eukprot:4001618-Prorocentrum_lima.AAC.1
MLPDTFLTLDLEEVLHSVCSPVAHELYAGTVLARSCWSSPQEHQLATPCGRPARPLPEGAAEGAGYTT